MTIPELIARRKHARTRTTRKDRHQHWAAMWGRLEHDLEGCPICGKPPLSVKCADGSTHVVCVNVADCHSHVETWGRTPEEARANWNRRATPVAGIKRARRLAVRLCDMARRAGLSRAATTLLQRISACLG